MAVSVSIVGVVGGAVVMWGDVSVVSIFLRGKGGL